VRVGELLGPGGRVVVELDPPGSRHGSLRVRIEHGDRCSDWFGWAHAAAEHVHSLAAASSGRKPADGSPYSTGVEVQRPEPAAATDTAMIASVVHGQSFGADINPKR